MIYGVISVFFVRPHFFRFIIPVVLIALSPTCVPSMQQVLLNDEVYSEKQYRNVIFCLNQFLKCSCKIRFFTKVNICLIGLYLSCYIEYMYYICFSCLFTLPININAFQIAYLCVRVWVKQIHEKVLMMKKIINAGKETEVLKQYSCISKIVITSLWKQDYLGQLVYLN